jgi:hypothetical protein
MSIYVGVLLFASYGGSCDGGCVGGAPGLVWTGPNRWAAGSSLPY